ncbi:MAG: ABC transporter substrate-binding protein [Streptosporangiaceae bacterium]
MDSNESSSHNRRVFLRGAGLAGLTAALGPGLLAACSSSPSSRPASSASALDFVPGGGKDVDQVNWATVNNPVSMDSTLEWDFDSNSLVPSITESLLKFDATGAPQPNLAMSYKYSSLTSLVLQIRQGVRFHDGSLMTPADVAFSINRTKPAVAINTSAQVQHLKSASVTGANEVTVTFDQHDPDYVGLLATTLGAVHSQAYVTAKGQAYGSPSVGAMGTGPYKFVSWVAEQAVTITKNDSYWNKQVTRHVKNFTVHIIPDPTTMIYGLANGTIDGVFSPSLTGLQVASLRNSPNLHLLQAPNYLTELLSLNVTSPPFSDRRVRQALSYAINRPVLSQAAWGGLADGTIRSPATPASWSWARPIFKAGYDALPSYSYDLDKAKKLMAEAGGANGAGGDVIYREPWQEPLALAIQSAGNSIGLKLQPTSLPSVEYVARRVGMQYGGALLDHTGTYANPAQVMNLFRSGPTGDDVPHYNNSLVNHLYDQQQVTVNPDDRAKLVVQLETIAMEDAPYVLLFGPNTTLLLNKRLGGYRLNPLWTSLPYINDLSGV